MLNKVTALTRLAGMALAIIAGFVAMPGMNVALALVVLGLVSGLTMPAERMLMFSVAVLAYPVLGMALTNIPAIGDQLNAITGNLQLALAGGLSTAVAMRIWESAKDALGTLTGGAK